MKWNDFEPLLIENIKDYQNIEHQKRISKKSDKENYKTGYAKKRIGSVDLNGYQPQTQKEQEVTNAIENIDHCDTRHIHRKNSENDY